MNRVEAFLLGQSLGARWAGARARVFARALSLLVVGAWTVGCGGPSQAPDVPPAMAIVAPKPSAAPSPSTNPQDPAHRSGLWAQPQTDMEGAPAAPTKEPAVRNSVASQATASAFQPLLAWTQSQHAQVYAALLDLESEEWLVLHQADQAINVASNAKIVTSAAALSLLGPDYQFTTELFGSMVQGDRCERLVLRGGGAPDLSVVDLYRFVSVLKGRGARRVEHVVVDQSRFAGSFVPPAFEQQPNEWAPFRANISALALDGNAVTLNVLPARVGEAARVWYDPVGAVTGSGQVMTSASGTGDAVSWQLSDATSGPGLHSKVAGRLAADAGRRRYQRRLDDPTLVGGWVLRELLVQAGIEVGDVQAGVRKGEERWAAWSSRPVAELVRKLGKDSDNFTAEMLLVALSSAEPQLAPAQKVIEPWSPARGARALDGWLRKLGLWTDGTVVKNGSGLFDANRYSPRLLVGVLAHVENEPAVYYDFVSHLAMGATDGTLKQRMLKQPLAARIRAKTGTLRDVDALTGYIVRSGGRPPLAFSLVVVQGKVAHGEVRKRMDQTVIAWAQLAERGDPLSD